MVVCLDSDFGDAPHSALLSRTLHMHSTELQHREFHSLVQEGDPDPGEGGQQQYFNNVTRVSRLLLL